MISRLSSLTRSLFSLQRTYVFILVGLLPLVAHLLYSPLGFNPTDYGFILAGARRVLDGQIPHVDFVSVRPVGSYYLHAPILIIESGSAFILSRFVGWVEFGVIAGVWFWLTTRAVARLVMPQGVRVLFLTAVAGMAFMFTANIRPVFPWHTGDAIFMASLGLALIELRETSEQPTGRSSRRSKALHAIGYVILGSTILFRLNFAAVPLAIILLYRDWRKVSTWIAVALPSFVYLALPVANGGLGDVYQELVAVHGGEVIPSGVQAFLGNLNFVLALLSVLVAWWLATGDGPVRLAKGAPQIARRLAHLLDHMAVDRAALVAGAGAALVLLLISSGEPVRHYRLDRLFLAGALPIGSTVMAVLFSRTFGLRTIGPLAIGAMVLVTAASLLRDRKFDEMAFVLLGALAGTLLFAVFSAERRPWSWPELRIGIVALVIGWSASLSIGGNHPARAAGIIAVVLLSLAVGFVWREDSGDYGQRWAKKLAAAGLAVLLLITVPAFHVARQSSIYRDLTASELNSSLAEVLPGMSEGNIPFITGAPLLRPIKTNPRTYDAVVDMALAQELALDHASKYAILADWPANWVASQQQNPLPVDWVLNVELPDGRLRNKVMETLRSGEPVAVIVPRFDMRVIAVVALEYEPDPNATFGNAVLSEIFDEFIVVEETRYYTVLVRP